ncbi:MAG: hypothetical protein KC422_19160 [Trueperaceae bacterium]|nr:hypothetical protein [Trueperaceae bacterium]
MKTKRLEQENSYRQSFQSQVIAKELRQGKAWVALAESAFYPSSGGQLFDIGSLNDLPVSNVEKEGDLVWHQLEQDSLQVGDSVAGVIDWSRRFRHMQRHSAQHLLSQALLKINADFETKAVSLSSETCTVDFAANPEAHDLLKAEELVNTIAYQNLAIRAFEVDEQDIAKYPLRRPPKVSGRIRLVEMGDFELSACGGTHVRSTAEVAPIKILRLERIRGGLSRVYFKAGLEALADYREKHEVCTQLGQKFSAQVAELPARVDALSQDLLDTRFKLKEAQHDNAQYLARELIAQAKANNTNVIVHSLDANSEALLAPLAQALTQVLDYALLGLKSPEKASLLFTRSETASHPMNDLLKNVLPLIGGRGGGKADRAQGAGSRLEGLAEALSQAAKLLNKP